MAEYVDRGALLAAYDATHEGEPGRARKLIADAPAADVAPVVHGKWIYNVKWMGWECSVCGCNVDTLRKFPYCHGCGSRMDGDS